MQNGEEMRFFERPQRSRGFDLPARMTVLRLRSGGLVLVSPLALDEEKRAAIRAWGEVRYIVAPNLLHHLHLSSAVEAFPEAELWGPPGLSEKRADLSWSGSLAEALPEELAEVLFVVRLEGAPLFDEFALFHPVSGALILTDLVFHVLAPRGFLTNLVLGLNGCRGRLAVSRVWKFAVKDRSAFQASLGRVLELPFMSVVVAHGENLESEARERLRTAFAARFG